MNHVAPRRSTRLSIKQTTKDTPTRSKRHVNKPPLILVSDSEDEEVIYLAPRAPPLVDLTRDSPIAFLQDFKKLREKEKAHFKVPPNTPSKSEQKTEKNSHSSFDKEELPKLEQNEKEPPRTPQKSRVSPIKEPLVILRSPPKFQEELSEPEQIVKSPFKEPPRTPHKTKSKTVEDRLVTPPKQRKFTSSNENVPVTPPTTPTVLLERLSLLGSEEKNNRRKLFQETDLYANARRALHSTCPTTMPGREKEISELRNFISTNVEDKTSGTLYISGPPGTGKTASLNLILEDSQLAAEIKQVYVNCTSIKSSGSIFARIAKDLGVKTCGKSERDHIGAIEKFLQRSHKTTLLVLDEIDQLESKKQSVLYTIFEWPAVPNSNLILIGIANALDLTDRILPRLQARCELKPQLMHFAPYTKQQIVEIFTNRLKTAGVIDIFSPVALQMLAGKVAAVSGDVRRALDIGRRVIEMIDKRKKGENMLKSVENLAESLDVEVQAKKLETVDLKQVVNVLNNVYGTTQNLEDDVDDAFPLQQKIVVCSLLLILKKAKNKDVTIGRLHDVYRRVCVKRNIQVVDQGEFVGLCSLIETRGIIKIIKKKDPRLCKISLVWDEEEVAGALKDKQLMSMILQDDSCLGKM